jgi:hypothetical protein
VFAANAYAAAADWPSAVREAGLAMKLAGQPQEKIDRFLAGGGEPAVKAFARGVLEFRQGYKGAVPAFAAGYYAYLGDTQGALADLERAQRERWRYLLVTVGADPDLERLRDEPRYRAVRRALGLPEAYGPS